MSINYEKLLSTSDIQSIDIKKVNSIKGKAKATLGFQEITTLNYYSGYSGIFIMDATLRENKAKEEIKKVSNKDLLPKEKLLLAANIVYYDDKSLSPLLKLGNITLDDLKNITNSIDNAKYLKANALDLEMQKKKLLKLYMKKSKNVFDFKKAHEDTKKLELELTLLKNELLQINNVITNLEKNLEISLNETSLFLDEIYKKKLYKLNEFFGTKNIYHLYNKLTEIYALKEYEFQNSKQKSK